MRCSLHAIREKDKSELEILEAQTGSNIELSKTVETLRGELSTLQGRYDGQKAVLERMKTAFKEDHAKFHGEEVEFRVLKDDVEKQLKAATSEITKLQAEKSKLESGIAAMQAKVARMRQLGRIYSHRCSN